MTERVIGCEEALRALAAYLDQELPADEYDTVHRHLETCQSCFSRAEFERRLGTQLADLGRHAPEPAFQGRIRRLLDGFNDQPEDQE
jgi:anti-sigma factor (TIGR02949 family)